MFLLKVFEVLQDMSGNREDGDSLLARSHVEKTKDNGYKFILGRFWLDMRKKFFRRRQISHWNNFLRKMMDSPVSDS